MTIEQTESNTNDLDAPFVKTAHTMKGRVEGLLRDEEIVREFFRHGFDTPTARNAFDRILAATRLASPTRDGAEGAGKSYCSPNFGPQPGEIGFKGYNHETLDAAPPKPAPDAMEVLSALEPFTKLGGGQNPRDAAAGLYFAAYYDLPGDTVIYKNSGACITADDVRTARRVYKANFMPASPDWTAANDFVKSTVRQAGYPAAVPGGEGQRKLYCKLRQSAPTPMHKAAKSFLQHYV